MSLLGQEVLSYVGAARSGRAEEWGAIAQCQWAARAAPSDVCRNAHAQSVLALEGFHLALPFCAEFMAAGMRRERVRFRLTRTHRPSPGWRSVPQLIRA